MDEINLRVKALIHEIDGIDIEEIQRILAGLRESLQILDYDWENKSMRGDHAQSLEDQNEFLDQELNKIVGMQQNIAKFLFDISAIISTGQRIYLKCQLPHHTNPPHTAIKTKMYVCQLNPQHLFCRKHKLDRCIRCGGNLK